MNEDLEDPPTEPNE